MFPPIYTILSTAPAVTAVVGSAIYPHGDAPQGTLSPYITWFVVSAPPELIINGTPPHDRFTIQVDCWHITPSGIISLSKEVRDALEPHCHVTNLLLNQRDPETKLYRIALQLDYFLNR